jgi:hypothetical protein
VIWAIHEARSVSFWRRRDKATFRKWNAVFRVCCSVAVSLACRPAAGLAQARARALALGFPNDPAEPRQRIVNGGFTRAEGEARVMQEARGATAATLAGIHVEKVPGDGDDFVLQRRAE